MPRVLHVTAQRPGLTGSGVTLQALARGAAAAGWSQAAVCGVPTGDPSPAIPGLLERAVEVVTFGPGGDLPFAVPGMSDVMPYPSRVWSTLEAHELDAYRAAWRAALARAIARFRPDVLHVHHAWLVAALACEVAGRVPVVVHGHGSDLRQLELCPHLADEVRDQLASVAAAAVLHADHAARYGQAFGWPGPRLHVVGAGYDHRRFHAEGRVAARDAIVFVGKLSDAKGVPWLIEAVERLALDRPGVRLTLVGGGDGPEARAIRARAAASDVVCAPGPLFGEELTACLRSQAVFCLPSLWEGLPLVLVEAAASGCRLVATALPGVVDALAPALGEALELVSVPERVGPDRVAPRAEAGFVDDLVAALARALDAGPVAGDRGALRSFTWDAVARRVMAVWDGLS